MATNLTYAGRGTDLPYDDIIVEGLDPWPAGETRLFDDAFAAAHGWQNGDEYAVYVATVYNRNRGTPWFILEPAPAAPEPAAPEPATSAPEAAASPAAVPAAPAHHDPTPDAALFPWPGDTHHISEPGG